MSKVISLSGSIRGIEPDPDVVALLEAALERARAGQVIAVGVVEIHANGATQDDWAGVVPLSIVGALARLSYRIVSGDA